MSIVQGLSIAAILGHQGNRTMYQVLVENSVLNNFFTVNMDPPTEKSQRQLDPKHASAIAGYILDNPDEYVLGTVIYAVDNECDFKASEIDERLGVLTIPFGTNLRSLDGQHRRQGLNEAIAQDAALGSDHTAVLIYVESDVDKRRQMFSDMNATPKVVAKALNVAFDQRDPFARVAMSVSRDHSLLAGKVDFESRQISTSSQKWYTVGAIHDVLKRLQVGPTGRVRNANQYSEDAIHDAGVRFFDALERGRAEYKQVSDGSTDIVSLRSQTILFSSTTLRAISGGVYEAEKRVGMPLSVEHLALRLAGVDFTPGASMWQESGFVSPGKSTPNARNQEVLSAIRRIATHLAA